MATHRWNTSLTRSVAPDVKGWSVLATDRRAFPYAPTLQIQAVAGLRRFPAKVAGAIANYLQEHDVPPPAMRLVPMEEPNCRWCGHPTAHMAGCFKDKEGSDG